jgi:hypothetical protein
MRMSGRVIWTWGAAIALAGSAAPQLSAQQAATNVVTPAPPPAPDTVGPEQLRDFSLPGTVTRRTDSPPPAASNTLSPQAQSSDAPPLPVRTRPVSSEPSRSVTVALPPPDPLAREPTLAPPVDELSNNLSAAPEPVESVTPEPASLPADGNLGSWMPWLFALLIFAAGVGLYLWRQRNAARPAYAGRMRVEELIAEPAAAPAMPRVAQPVPAPVPTPAPARAPAPPRSDGIISSSLRPWIDIEFGATRAVVTDDAATVHFDIILYNSGGAPARDVLVEGRMFNAGPDQDRELGGFMEQPVAKGEPIPEIAPLSRVALKSAVALPRTALKEYEIEGRKLFVPILGFNALYRFGANQGQTSASFIVGRGGDDGGKMAPIRLDLGPRIFRGLSQRQHSVGVRA